MRIRAWLPDTASNRAAADALVTELERFAAFSSGGVGLRGIGPLLVRPIPAEEWATSWRAEFPILRVGRILVRPPWREHTTAPGDAVVTIDPGQAFGTGLHPTTRLALMGLEKWSADGRLGELPRSGPGVLDVGTGSGILLLAAIALGASHGTGVDIDPLSVAAATENAARNGVAERVTIQAGSLPISAPAPLVMANLVATLHIELAPLLVGAMAPGGRLLASGMFVSRADEAIAALQAAGATLVERWEEGEWVAAEFSDGRATLAS